MATLKNCEICFLGAMDKLWFHQMILFSDEPELEVTTKTDQFPYKEENSNEEKQVPESNNLVLYPSRKLMKSVSCKSFGELELEEVKGFMDLGFVFEKENLSKRMMRLIPGLHRINDVGCNNRNIGEKNSSTESLEFDDDRNSVDDDIVVRGEEEEENDEDTGVMRPYLSEAWLIKRPDSPLLNLKIPRVSTRADMKKHLKYWARTVAYEIQQQKA